MSDPRSPRTDQHRQSEVRQPPRGDPQTLDEAGVFGGTLFERHSKPGETVIRLYGALDLSAAGRLDEEQLIEAMQTIGEVRLDVTGLTQAEPEALRLFLARQRTGQRLAQHLTIRINPDQVPDLFPEQSEDSPG